MKKLLLVTTLMTCLLLTAKTRLVAQTPILAYCYFEHGGNYVGLCTLPNMIPYTEDSDGNYLGAVSCPYGVSFVNVVEGQQIRFWTKVYYQNRIQFIYSPYYTVTATDLANGFCFLVAPI